LCRKEPLTGTVSILKNFLPNQHLHERRSGFLYGPITVAAESLIAQLDPQGKFTTPRRENRKIRHENEILQANEHTTVSDLSIDTKNICANLARLSLARDRVVISKLRIPNSARQLSPDLDFKKKNTLTLFQAVSSHLTSQFRVWVT
jgi:hypothetical protein